MPKFARFLLCALVAAGIAAPAVAAPSDGPPQPLITKMIEKFRPESLTTHYVIHSIKVAPPRVFATGEAIGIAGGTKVWSVLVSYTMYTHAGDVTKSWSICDRSDATQTYHFWKNEFGDWAFGSYSSSENSTKDKRFSPCSTLPGLASIFPAH